MKFNWSQASGIGSHSFTCGWCNHLVGPKEGFHASSNHNNKSARIFICSHCNYPTFFEIHGDSYYSQSPAVPLGRDIPNLPDNINQLYTEIRNATGTSAYTLALLGSRVLLMHIAVAQGAEEGWSFIRYVDYLVDNHFAPPKSKPWVDKIRNIGNLLNHEIKIANSGQVEEVMKFTEMLLIFLYEFSDHQLKEVAQAS